MKRLINYIKYYWWVFSNSNINRNYPTSSKIDKMYHLMFYLTTKYPNYKIYQTQHDIYISFNNQTLFTFWNANYPYAWGNRVKLRINTSNVTLTNDYDTKLPSREMQYKLHLFIEQNQHKIEHIDISMIYTYNNLKHLVPLI